MHELPAGYVELLVDITIAVLQDQPEDFLDYAAKFFHEAYEKFGQSGIYQSKNVSQDVFRTESIISEESDDKEIHLKPKANFRRKSVAAERIDTDDLDVDEEKFPIFPKTDEQRLLLKRVCEKIMLFKNLDEEQLNKVINTMFEIKTKPGEKIIVQGDEGDNFYVIEEGVYDCYIKEPDGNEKKIHTYNNEGYFGELALMYNAQRSATVTSNTEGKLWAMDRQTFRTLVVAQTHQKKIVYDQFLKEFPIFNELTAGERMNVADALISKSYSDNEIIIQQGKPGSEMFFIEEGEVSIIRTQNNETKELVRLHKGQYFGELALLSNQARQASGRAIGETKCAKLDVKTFERLMGPCLELMKRNAKDYEKQLSEVFENGQN